jgi:magnesium transporter
MSAVLLFRHKWNRLVCDMYGGTTLTNRTPGQKHDLDGLAINNAHRDFARVYIGQTVADALAEVQRSKLESRIVYFYVVDEDGRLQGVVPTRRLLLSPPSTPVSKIMVRRAIALSSRATLLDACEMFIFHRLMALPITDDEGKILGVIDVDQYTEEIRQLDEREQSDEIFQLIGVRLAQVRQAPLPILFRSRFPWLLCNITGGVTCAFIAGFFEKVLDQVIVIALFIPVVLALAESVSIQSLTLAIQLQHRRPAPWAVMLRALRSEMPLGLMLGAACGGLVAGIAWLWQGDGVIAACILASISLSVMLAAVFGLLVPSLLHKLQRDPQVASGPLTLALTDIVTMVVYLGLGTWLLL